MMTSIGNITVLTVRVKKILYLQVGNASMTASDDLNRLRSKIKTHQNMKTNVFTNEISLLGRHADEKFVLMFSYAFIYIRKIDYTYKNVQKRSAWFEHYLV